MPQRPPRKAAGNRDTASRPGSNGSASTGEHSRAGGQLRLHPCNIRRQTLDEVPQQNGRHRRTEFSLELALESGIDGVSGDVGPLDGNSLNRIAQIAGGELDLLLERSLAAEISRPQEKRLRSAENRGREVLFADVKEETIARGRGLADCDRVPDVQADGLDQDDLDPCGVENALDGRKSLIDCAEDQELHGGPCAGEDLPLDAEGFGRNRQRAPETPADCVHGLVVAIGERGEVDEIHPKPRIGEEQRDLLDPAGLELHAPDDVGQGRFVREHRRHHRTREGSIRKSVGAAVVDAGVLLAGGEPRVKDTVGIEDGDIGRIGSGHYSTNVTLLISRKVVLPSITFCSADSRRKTIPSSPAAFLISEAGRRSMIIVRMWSERSSSSEIARRPWNPVPLHSRHPAPSQNVVPRYSTGLSPDSTRNESGYFTSCRQPSQTRRTSRCARTQFSADTKL